MLFFGRFFYEYISEIIFLFAAFVSFLSLLLRIIYNSGNRAKRKIPFQEFSQERACAEFKRETCCQSSQEEKQNLILIYKTIKAAGRQPL